MQDLYINTPITKFPAIKSPVLFIAAGDGGSTFFSANKAKDITTAVSLISAPSKVEWFPDSPHDVITLYPSESADVIHATITHFFKC